MSDRGPSASALAGLLSGYVERSEVPGLVALVSRHGELQTHVLGRLAAEGPQPMRRDTIFRITSMTKPVVAAAAMILVDEGKLGLDQSVEPLLPELANRRVLTRIDGPLDETVPALRPITVEDVLSSRMGFGVPMARPDSYPIQRAASALDLKLGEPKPRTSLGVDAWMRALGSLPLMHQPGERWMYNTASDVLGVLISRAAGQPLERFLRERLFEPLGMKDTSFCVPPAKRDRFASCYQADAKTGALVLRDGVADSPWCEEPTFPEGRGGLVSTADDYLAFGRLLLDDGLHAGKSILSARSTALLTTDHLTPAQASSTGFLPKGAGWGFGLAVSPAGWFGWDGGYGTTWRSDRKRGLVGILLTQRTRYPRPSGIEDAFWSTIYDEA